ncbi:MAG: hypothetical protein RL563_779 [Pseudomonadota bacterium]|jgi:hypothetical protein
MQHRGWRIGIIGLMVLGCSSQEEVSISAEAKPRETLTTASPSYVLSPENIQPRFNDKPSRSELRLLDEQNKVSEAQAQAIIERYSQHLGDSLERQTLQSEFKRLLPVYKANQLALGKAKLREVKNHAD